MNGEQFKIFKVNNVLCPTTINSSTLPIVTNRLLIKINLFEHFPI